MHHYLKLLLGVAGLLILLAACGPEEETESTEFEPDLVVRDILVSTNADFGEAKPLDASRVSGEIYAFADPTLEVRGANFYLDDRERSGTPIPQTNTAPRTQSATTDSSYFDTKTLGEGVHTLTAELSLAGGGSRVVTSTFLVDNDGDARDALLVSTSKQRTGAKQLAGATLTKDVYIYLIPEQSVTSIAFYIDGKLNQTERYAFYDAAGTASDGSARPFDTTSLADGKHTVTVVMTSASGEKEVSAEFTVANNATQPPPMTGSANLCEGFPTDKNQVVIPQLDKPGVLEPYTDPAFGARVTRITDSTPGGVIKPLYNTVQAWNADESRLILYHTGTEDAGHHLYDGQSYRRIKKLDIVPADIEQVFWDATDADTFYYVSKVTPDYGDLIRYSAESDEKQVIKTFDDVCGGDYYPAGGNDVQMMSLDGDVIGLRCKQATSDEPRDKTFYYRISTDTISEVLPVGEGTPYAPWNALQPAPSGERFFLNGDVLNEQLEVERTLDTTRRSNGSYKPEHAVLGQTSDGTDAFYSVIFNRTENGCDGDANGGIGALTAYDMETGQCRVLIGQSNGYGYPVSSTHPSALSYKNPGWVAVSSVGGQSQTGLIGSDQEVPLFFSEIYLANADPANPQVCRLAHHRSFGKGASGDYAPYFGEPHPVISPSGTRILFGSDWYDSGSVDTYVIELPGE